MALASFGAPVLAAGVPVAHWKYDNPFCDVIAAAAPLPDVVASVSLSPGNSRYALQLHARAGATLGAHVTFVSDTDAYDAAVPVANLSGPAEDRERETLVVALPSPDRAGFFFVDSYSVDGHASVTCPSYVFPVGEPLASGESGAVVAATHLQSLGKLPCGQVYRPIGFGEDFGSLTGRYGNRPHSVRYHAYVDSNGRALREVLLQSSGVPGVDAAALGDIQIYAFKPAQFLCTPVVGEVVIEMDYNP
jgi:hypothetical protein